MVASANSTVIEIATGSLQSAINRGSSHWSAHYFEKKLPIAEIINERRAAAKIANLVSNNYDFKPNNYMSDDLLRGRRKYQKPESEEFVNKVVEIAKNSTLGSDKTFLAYLADFACAVYDLNCLGAEEKEESKLALIGHAIAGYEMLKECGIGSERIESLGAYDVFKVHGLAEIGSLSMKLAKEAEGLKNRVENIRQMPKEGEQAEGQAGRIDEMIRIHSEAQKITYTLLDFMQRKYGLVFVPQEEAKDIAKHGFFAPEYMYHTEPAFRSTNHDDTVAYYFGVPFLPLSKEREDFLWQRGAMITAFEEVGHALREAGECAERIGWDDDKFQDQMEKFPFSFGKQLRSYADLLRPVSRFYQGNPVPYNDDWSLPTFSFAKPLGLEFGKLLSTRGEELPVRVVADIKLTIEVLEVRTKLFELKMAGFGKWGSREDKLWGQLEAPFRKQCRDHNEFQYIPNRIFTAASLSLMGYKESGEQAKMLNDAGIEEIIGRRLPEN